MSGNRIGGAKAASKNKQLYGADFYSKIGSKGGKASGTGGFHHSKVTGKNWHKEAGRKGGHISKPTNPWGHKTPKLKWYKRILRRKI